MTIVEVMTGSISYEVGDRHHTVMEIARACMVLGVSLTDCNSIVRELCAQHKDSELKDRLDAVKGYYSEYNGGDHGPSVSLSHVLYCDMLTKNGVTSDQAFFDSGLHFVLTPALLKSRFTPGQKVKFVRDVQGPFASVTAGETGTVKHVQPEGKYRVTMDRQGPAVHICTVSEDDMEVLG